MTRQDKTRQDKTRQDKTRQDNVAHDTSSCQAPAQIKVVGSLDSSHESFESANRVYDTEGLSPTIKARDYKDPSKILVPMAVDEMADVNVLGNYLGHISNFAGTVYDKNGLSPTLRTPTGGNTQPMIIDDEKPVVMDIYNKRRLDGDVCGTITANGNASSTHCGTFLLKEDLPEERREETEYRIRKLTPRETWRLMGYTDEDFDKAASVNSNSQLYKQAGNAIVKQVLMAIFSQMNIRGVKPWNDGRMELWDAPQRQGRR